MVRFHLRCFQAWAISFTPLCLCLSEETLKAVGPNSCVSSRLGCLEYNYLRLENLRRDMSLPMAAPSVNANARRASACLVTRENTTNSGRDSSFDGSLHIYLGFPNCGPRPSGGPRDGLRWSQGTTQCPR